ncbi:MAG: APC family permease [Polyangiales bacterium]
MMTDADRRHDTHLRAGAIGMLGAATLGVVMLSPAMSLYGGFGPTFLEAGRAAPLVFVWALVATIPTAISYALLSREHPDSGSTASWTRRALSARVGHWAGWMVFFYYFANFAIQPITLGLFLNDILIAFRIPVSFVTFSGGVVGCTALGARIVYRGISPSTKGALGFLLFETAVVIALCATVIARPIGGAHLSLEGFHISASRHGFSGLLRALVFAMLSFCGFDVVSTVAEESRMARKLIPQATLLSLIIFAFLITAGVWALTYAQTPDAIAAIANAGGMPITEVARSRWGRLGVLVAVTGFSAALGIAIATSVGASRVLFSMARDGAAPPRFAALHPVNRVPTLALHVVFGAGTFGGLVTALAIGPYNSYLWWATISTAFALITYVLVNLANIIIFRARLTSTPFGWLLHGVLPLLGLGIDAYILVHVFGIDLWAQPWATGKSVLVSEVVVVLLAIALVLVVGSARHTRNANDSGSAAR